ncbi:hypothetical protein LSAT2_005832 [Lamellibrachia satsuma]|nr:hypothetical protein LSAT2_005832 [Lamellibrachia satsuma]
MAAPLSGGGFAPIRQCRLLRARDEREAPANPDSGRGARRARRGDGSRRQVFHYEPAIDPSRNSISVRRRSDISYSLVALHKAPIVSQTRFGRFLALERQRRKSIREGYFWRKFAVTPER